MKWLVFDLLYFQLDIFIPVQKVHWAIIILQYRIILLRLGRNVREWAQKRAYICTILRRYTYLKCTRPFKRNDRSVNLLDFKWLWQLWRRHKISLRKWAFFISTYFCNKSSTTSIGFMCNWLKWKLYYRQFDAIKSCWCEMVDWLFLN